VAVAIAAFVALFRCKVDIMKVIGACALVGLAYTLLT
jgi:chromate transporter